MKMDFSDSTGKALATAIRLIHSKEHRVYGWSRLVPQSLEASAMTPRAGSEMQQRTVTVELVDTEGVNAGATVTIEMGETSPGSWVAQNAVIYYHQLEREIRIPRLPLLLLEKE